MSAHKKRNNALMAVQNATGLIQDFLTVAKALGFTCTVRHGRPKFVICSWCVNGAKSDLRVDEFYRLCVRILKHRDGRIQHSTSRISTLEIE